ncbi:hypothetical protein HMI56_005101, partial [Coelomomyces lativittatus]
YSQTHNRKRKVPEAFRHLSAEPVKVRKTDEEHTHSSVGTSSRISSSQTGPSPSPPRTSTSVKTSKHIPSYKDPHEFRTLSNGSGTVAEMDDIAPLDLSTTERPLDLSIKKSSGSSQ